MDIGMFPDDGVNSWNTVMLLYESAIKKFRTKVEILNDEFQQVHQYNPIEYIKTRVKTPESIVKKLKKNGYEVSIPSMIEHCNDIAGVRIVCSFTSSILVVLLCPFWHFFCGLIHLFYFLFLFYCCDNINMLCITFLHWLG